jgi:hypothetical protein
MTIFSIFVPIYIQEYGIIHNIYEGKKTREIQRASLSTFEIKHKHTHTHTQVKYGKQNTHTKNCTHNEIFSHQYQYLLYSE